MVDIPLLKTELKCLSLINETVKRESSFITREFSLITDHLVAPHVLS